MAIEESTAKVYRATTARRRYFSKQAAIHAEARALIEKKHPSEKHDPECGGGFHWSELPRSAVLYRRVRRLVKRSM